MAKVERQSFTNTFFKAEFIHFLKEDSHLMSFGMMIYLPVFDLSC